MDPPNGYTIGGEGQGGVAGFAKGGAKVALTDDAGATLLHYDVNAQVGGKIAQLGARLIDATAKQMADAFFTRFTAQVEAAAAPAPVAAAVEPGTVAASDAPAPGPVATHPPASAVAPPSAVSMFDLVPREPFGLPLAFWIGGGVFAVIVLLFLASSL
jgi:hypothetical protein